MRREACKLNHETLRFRLINPFGATVARVEEVEAGHTRQGRVLRGYVYTEDGRRIMVASVPAPQPQPQPIRPVPPFQPWPFGDLT